MRKHKIGINALAQGRNLINSCLGREALMVKAEEALQTTRIN